LIEITCEQDSLFTPEQLAGRVPDTGWRPPVTFPRLDAAKKISLDLETKDPNLIEKGPGEVRGDGRIVGVAVGVDTGERWYFPMRHEFGSGNMNPEMVLRWCRDELCRDHQPKIGANLMYDLSWLHAEGVDVKGDMIDVQYAQALLNENQRSYSLDSCANIWLNEGKHDNLLYQWCADTYGGGVNRKQAGNIYRAPSTLVGPYAEGDVDLPLRIWEKQKKALEDERLMELFKIESGLMPLLLKMRWHGVRVDLDKADKVRTYLNNKVKEAQKILDRAAGCPVNVDAADTIARAFDNQGIKYPRTAKTDKPSFTKPWLEAHGSELAKAIVTVRKYSKAVTTFIDSYIFGNEINGWIHTQFHPLRGDENGTVSGRFSSSGPNLQNMPSRDPELGPMIRSIFVPDEVKHSWRRYDYSQIEYRLLAHFARGPGADEARELYRKNPETDYHQMTRELIHDITGTMLERKPTKNINFGLCYGMSTPTLARTLGMTVAEATPLFEAYHEGVPFVKKTYDDAMSTAKKRGYVMTVLGRRRRFDYFEPSRFMTKDEREKIKALPEAEAIAEWGVNNVQRAGAHAALNAVLQGSSADMIKKAMLDAYEAGIFDVIGVPLITVHDELDHDDNGSDEAAEAFKALQQTMQDAIPLNVPVLADAEIGPNWGRLKEMAA
jgi:DNA polymerase I-like protein with 3'-5' exonuclease and polymerase domains